MLGLSSGVRKGSNLDPLLCGLLPRFEGSPAGLHLCLLSPTEPGGTDVRIRVAVNLPRTVFIMTSFK